jgi:hypothetical protein
MSSTTGTYVSELLQNSTLSKRMGWESKIDVTELFYNENNQIGKVYSLEYTKIPKVLFTHALLSIISLMYIRNSN